MSSLSNQLGFKNTTKKQDFDEEQLLDGLIKYGLSPEVANLCLTEKKMTADFIKDQDRIYKRQLLDGFKNRTFKEQQAALAVYKIAFYQHLFKPKKSKYAFRERGGLYIEHPVNVALIIEKQNPELPIDVALAGLLHDVIEDTEIEREELFNKILPFLSSPNNLESFKIMLEAVTKVEHADPKIAEIETYQKFGDSTHENPLAAIVKAADRYNNMATLSDMPLKSQIKTCRVNRKHLLPIFKKYGLDWFYEQILKQTIETEERLGLTV